MGFQFVARPTKGRDSIASAFAALGAFGLIISIVMSFDGSASAQALDCRRLQQEIAASGGGGGRVAAAIVRQRSELARTAAYARQLGCDRQQFMFFGGPSNPQCGGLNARISQMQANLGQLQEAGGGGGGRSDLVARYNAYCRGGGQPAQPQQRGFFESLFGGGDDPRAAQPSGLPPADAAPQDNNADGDTVSAHGGSQAVCVRTCDGGFFPMGLSSHHSAESLDELCKTLCPGTETAVYSRNPNAEIKTAVNLDGKPYMDLPNALKFQKNFDPTCSCRPAGKTWAEALANAESVLGDQRKGDIIVTPEKSAEMSRPKLDSRTKSSLLKGTDTASASAAAARNESVTDAAPAPAAASPVPAPQSSAADADGATRHVRRVGPQL